MTKAKIFNMGAIAFMLLGLIHLAAHYGMPAPESAQTLIHDMETYTIELMGTHSVLDFHNGYSIMMGLLMFIFGLQSYLVSHAILDNKAALWVTFLVSLVAFVVAFIFFHILAYGFILFSTICFGYPLVIKFK